MKWMLLFWSSATLVQAAENSRREYALGVLEKLRGQSEQASQRFEEARKLDPTAWPLVEIALRQRMSQGDRAGAIQLYRDLATARKEDLGIQMGWVDFLEGQPGSERQKILEASLRKWPAHPEIVRRLVSIHLASGGKEQAGKLLESLSHTDVEAVLLYASFSTAVYPEQEELARQRTAERYLAAMAAHPRHGYLARTVSDYFRNNGQPDLAIRVLETHVQALPSSLDLRTRLGILYFSNRQDTQGVQELEQVLQIDPQQAMAHQALAKYYRLRNQPEPARQHAAELLKIRGGSPGEFIKLSEEFLAAGNPRQARILLEKALFDSPDNIDLAAHLAIATWRDPETAAQAPRLFREAEAALPPSRKMEPSFLVESAEVFLSEGQSKPAEERLREAIRTYPPGAKKETAAALRRLAGLWEKESRNQEAARSLRQRADALDPLP